MGIRTAEGRNGTGANLRNYWVLGPEPFPEAHFATFPTEIPRRAILAGTSEKGCCPTCGAPWRRLVERSSVPMGTSGRLGTVIAGKGTATDQVRPGHDVRDGPTSVVVTLGWEPTCKCEPPFVREGLAPYPPAKPVPCVVLDPFAGSGTTVMVALRHDRRAIGFELNPDYVALARKRIQSDAPLWNTLVD